MIGNFVLLVAEKHPKKALQAKRSFYILHTMFFMERFDQLPSAQQTIKPIKAPNVASPSFLALAERRC